MLRGPEKSRVGYILAPRQQDPDNSNGNGMDGSNGSAALAASQQLLPQQSSVTTSTKSTKSTQANDPHFLGDKVAASQVETWKTGWSGAKRSG